MKAKFKIFLSLLLFLTAAEFFSRQACYGYQAYQRSEAALGTIVTITVPDTPEARQAVESSFNLVRTLEKCFSAHLPDSELVRLNLHGGGIVSEPMAELITRALVISRLSKGAFDPSCAPLIKLYKEAEKRGWPPAEKEIAACLKRVGWQKIRLQNRRLSLPNGMSLDLGGIAKGFIVDKVARYLDNLRLSGFLIDAGGDIFCSGLNPENKKWQIGIQSPWKEKEIVAIIRLSNSAVATSGDYRRYLLIKGKKYGHIVDPRTGKTVQEYPVSATVVAPDCTTADGLATACYVLGRKEGTDLLTKIKDVEGMLLDKDGEISATAGWQQLLSSPD